MYGSSDGERERESKMRLFPHSLPHRFSLYFSHRRRHHRRRRRVRQRQRLLITYTVTSVCVEAHH